MVVHTARAEYILRFHEVVAFVGIACTRLAALRRIHSEGKALFGKEGFTGGRERGIHYTSDRCDGYQLQNFWHLMQVTFCVVIIARDTFLSCPS